jgi:hypothetical protein
MNQNSQMGSQVFGYTRAMHTMLIFNQLRKSKLSLQPLWKDTLHKMLQEHRGYILSGWHVTYSYRETLKIRMRSHDNGTMNGHSILV